jgi:hypothetical protein
MRPSGLGVRGETQEMSDGHMGQQAPRKRGYDRTRLKRCTMAVKCGDVSGVMNRLLRSSFFGIPLHQQE